jgi:hypothetical protein
MRNTSACGYPGQIEHDDEPVWEPLLRAVGPRLTDTFMWMYASRLADGRTLHAYKHIHTRRYLHLTDDGQAFEWTPCRRYVPTRLDYALEAALCTWWILAGWDAEDAAAVREAIIRANREQSAR